MSASIHWKRVAKQGPTLKSVGAASSFIEAMERAFGRWPIRLDQKAIPVLRGMAAASVGQTFGQPQAYEEIIALIEEQDEIELEVVY